MERAKDKLGYTSFGEKAWEELENCLRLLRNVKLRFCDCSESCFEKPEVDLKSWKEVRLGCLEECQIPHNGFFDVFNEKFPQYRDSSTRCIYQCESEYTQTKYGEEDMTICEEKCYEVMFNNLLGLKKDLNDQYLKIYVEKFK